MKKEQRKGEDYEIIIQPNRSWFYVDWQGLLHYRDLLFLLVRRDFTAKYKQTILGPAWFILQPLLTTLVFTVIFGNITKIPTDGIPPLLFYLCGLLTWNYFAQCLNATSQTFLSNANIFQKVYFPRLIIPLSVILSNLLAFALQLLMFMGFYLYFKLFTSFGAIIKPNLLILILPLFLIQTAAVSLGVGLWMSALTIKYRDLQHLMGFLTQLWMYATPVIYPVSIIPEKWRLIIAFNPMAGIVESYRFAFFGEGYVNIAYLLISLVTSCLVLITGVLMFSKVERTFVDYI